MKRILVLIATAILLTGSTWADGVERIELVREKYDVSESIALRILAKLDSMPGAEWLTKLEKGGIVVLGAHADIDGKTAWETGMDRFVGRRATIRSFGYDADNGYEPWVIVYGNPYHWRLRNLKPSTAERRASVTEAFRTGGASGRASRPGCSPALKPSIDLLSEESEGPVTDLTVEDTELFEALPGHGMATSKAPSGAGSAKKRPAIEASRRLHTRPHRTTVKAGSHDDNEEYLTWLAYITKSGNLPMTLKANYTARKIVRIVDSEGKPVMNHPFTLVNREGKTLWTSTTYPNGENVIYPHTLLNIATDEIARVTLPGVSTSIPWKPGMDGIQTISLPTTRTKQTRVPVDIAFVLDATGSMSDEIRQLKDVLFSIHARLQNASSAADLRFALVVYRDRRDREPIRVIPFTSNVDSFQIALSPVRAIGGGDTPEDLHEGLRVTLEELDWRPGGIRAAFVIADAPPHTDYGQEKDYLWAGRTANARGIRLHTIGASGLRQGGEYIFRQIAAMTYGKFIFLTYGETGESSGRGTKDDPGKVSHHTGGNWSSRKLDDIVVDLVRRDLAYHVSVNPLTTDSPPPREQKSLLTLRMENLWGQIAKQIAASGGDSVTAVLLPFRNTMGDTALARYLHDVSTEMIVKTGPMKLVERERLDEILAKQKLAVSGLIDQAGATELGHLLGSRIVLMGRIYRLGTDRVVHVRAVDTNTARIVAAARVRV